MMKRLICLLSLPVALASAPVFAAGGGAVLSYTPELTNEASLQRGARNFMNYCSGCHGLKFLRYNRMARDLGIPEEVVEEQLMFTTDNINEHIEVAMPEASADWFGKQPPDLSLTARSRGADWIYSFLNTFYVDPSNLSTGYNNLQLENASMPHVLAELQGVVVRHEEAEAEGGDGHGGGHGGNHGLEVVEAGALSPDEYKAFTADLTNFLAYAAEPGKADRQSLGWKVLFYLLIFFGVAYLLKREYWKDVH
jgi:ubiquinol-cytochrome c reductase cytochrome c1 subunit